MNLDTIVTIITVALFFIAAFSLFTSILDFLRRN